MEGELEFHKAMSQHFKRQRDADRQENGMLWDEVLHIMKQVRESKSLTEAQNACSEGAGRLQKHLEARHD